uniref:Uncharacterized protein n=1 Tax=Tanacetum cinerariifolium TaxID=118510 RepID=A0A6L2N8U6_TANCI|nr:hypothetical protein [Tanacetum cinerariifolium]
MSKRYGYMFRYMKRSFMPMKDMDTISKMVKGTPKIVVPRMVNETTDENMRDNLPMVVSEGIKLESEKSKANIASMVADAVDAFLRNYMNSSRNLLLILILTLDHEDHHDDDARPEGKSRTDDDEVPSEEVSPELLAKMTGKGMKGQLKKRDNPDEVYSDKRTLDVMKVQYDQGHGQEFMKEIVVKRVNGFEWTKSGKKRRSFGVDVIEDFKEYTLRDYYCWLKTYCYWYKVKLLDNAVDSRLRLLEQSVAVDD